MNATDRLRLSAAGTGRSPVATTAFVERRAALRYSVNATVWIGRCGLCTVTATLIDISETGAAVRLRSAGTLGGQAWPFYLLNGDELWLTGLLPDMLIGWVIAVDDDVLRLHFWDDAGTRNRLSRLIEARFAARA